MKYVKGPYEIKLYYCIKKQDPKRKIRFLIFYLPHFLLKKFPDPFIGQKNNSSDYRLHGTQNDRLEPTVSAQKSVLKNIHRVLRYWPKHLKICRFGLEILAHFGEYLGTRCIFFKNNFCVETMSPVDFNTMNPIIRIFFSCVSSSRNQSFTK